MKLSSLQTLTDLKALPTIKPLFTKKISITNRYLSEIDLLLHCSNICLFARRLIDDEITVNNKELSLNLAIREIKRLPNLWKNNNYFDNPILKSEAKKTKKEIGIKPKHLKH